MCFLWLCSYSNVQKENMFFQAFNAYGKDHNRFLFSYILIVAKTHIFQYPIFQNLIILVLGMSSVHKETNTISDSPFLLVSKGYKKFEKLYLQPSNKVIKTLLLFTNDDSFIIYPCKTCTKIPSTTILNNT